MTLPLIGVIIGIAWLRSRKNCDDVVVVDDADPTQAVPDQFADMAEITWEAVYTVGDDTVWKYGVLMGLLYDDGTDDRYYEYHYLIGNSTHTSFTRESSTFFGHLQIDGYWAKVYANEAAAIAEADRLNEPDDGSSPQPQPQPQPDDDDDAPSLPPYVNPTLPSFGTDMGSYF